MTIEALRFIGDTLENAGIHYEFGGWSTSPIPSPYFIGEFTGIENRNEDGMQQSTMMLTGTSKNSWLELLEVKDKVEKLFPAVGKIAKLENGSCVAVFLTHR